MGKQPNPCHSAHVGTSAGFYDRAEVIERGRTAIERIKWGRYTQPIVILSEDYPNESAVLDELLSVAEKAGVQTAMGKAGNGVAITSVLVPMLRALLERLDDGGVPVPAVQRGLRVFRSFIETVRIPSECMVNMGEWGRPERGYADSGDLGIDLRDMLVALGQAARDAGRPVMIIIKGLQCLRKPELNALIRALHAVNQGAFPIAFLGTGRPQLPGQVGDAGADAERLFEFVALGEGEGAISASLPGHEPQRARKASEAENPRVESSSRRFPGIRRWRDE